MRNSETSVIGDIGEAKAIYEFSRRGIPVCMPLGNNLPYDMVVDCCGTLYKVQVKTISNLSDGKMYLSLTRTWYIKGWGNPNKDSAYTRDEVDLFFLYCIESDDCILVPFDVVSDAKYASFRYSHDIPLNGQKKFIRYVEDYFIDKTLENLGYIVTY